MKIIPFDGISIQFRHGHICGDIYRGRTYNLVTFYGGYAQMFLPFLVYSEGECVELVKDFLEED